MSAELTSLLKRYNISQSDLEIQCEDELFLTLMSKIPSFEGAVPYFGFTPPEIDELLMDNQKVNSRKISMLWKWRSRNGSCATYLAIVKIFLKMGSQELAEVVLKHIGASNPSLMKKPVQVWPSQCLDERLMKLSKQTEIEVTKKTSFSEQSEIEKLKEEMRLKDEKLQRLEKQVSSLTSEQITKGNSQPVFVQQKKAQASPLPSFDTDIDVSKMKRIIHGVLDKRYDDLCQLLSSTMEPLADKLFSVTLISKSVHSTPTYNSIMSEVKAKMSFMSDPVKVVNHCTLFLAVISELGSPQKYAAFSLAEEMSVAIEKDLKTKIDFHL